MLIAETDHLFLKEPKNRATPTKPMCYGFGYMLAKAPELRPVVAKWTEDPDLVDPCGPSPTIIHLPLLRKLTPEWLSLSFQLKRDPLADKTFGWVLEMWGYTLAAARLRVRHLVWDAFQVEPSSLWHSDLDGDPHIFHYTYGLEYVGEVHLVLRRGSLLTAGTLAHRYTADGLPVTGVGDWSLDKRHFMGSFPPKQLAPPPGCAGKAAHVLARMFNEASEHTLGWVSTPGQRGTTGYAADGDAQSVAALTEDGFEASPFAQSIVGRGAWQWEGKAPLLFYRGGRAYTPWGSGTWGLATAEGGRSSNARSVDLSLGKCGRWRLTFASSGKSFTATSAAGDAAPTSGALAEPHERDASNTDPLSSTRRAELPDAAALLARLGSRGGGGDQLGVSCGGGSGQSRLAAHTAGRTLLLEGRAHLGRPPGEPAPRARRGERARDAAVPDQIALVGARLPSTPRATPPRGLRLALRFARQLHLRTAAGGREGRAAAGPPRGTRQDGGGGAGGGGERRARAQPRRRGCQGARGGARPARGRRAAAGQLERARLRPSRLARRQVERSVEPSAERSGHGHQRELSAAAARRVGRARAAWTPRGVEQRAAAAAGARLLICTDPRIGRAGLGRASERTGVLGAPELGRKVGRGLRGERGVD